MERAMELQGNVAIVTGGGIGKESSKLLAAAGAIATAKEIETNHVPALPIKADVSSAAEVVAMVEQTERALGRLDVLVNNAGYTKFISIKASTACPKRTGSVHLTSMSRESGSAPRPPYRPCAEPVAVLSSM
jgi:NAD(P)-dependent dehydrogenase (short-subunit alcohol dehydrogenase family)